MGKNRINKNISLLSAIVMILLFVTPKAFCESTSWNCPECGRTGNTGNYCGGCAYPAPWIELVEEEGICPKEEFKTVGNIVTFGHYEQDNTIANGKEPIEWIVLEYDDENQKTLLISKYCLISMVYNKSNVAVAWENCTLRNWLNEDFLDDAFNEEEGKTILTTEVNNCADQGYSYLGTSGGNNTRDQIFLLSCAEANHYFGVTTGAENTKSRASATAYAISLGDWTNHDSTTDEGEPAGRWRLWSSGFDQTTAAFVNDDGSLACGDVASDRNYIRPVLWLNLDSDIF